MDLEPTEQPLTSAESLTPTSAVLIPPSKGGFWRRAVAYTVDLAFLELIYGLYLMVGATALDLAQAQDFGLAPWDDSRVAYLISFMALWVALFLLYFTFFTYYGGQTPGKMLLQIRVVTKDLEELTLLRALARSLCYFLSSLFFGLGFLIAAFDRDKRALHDFIAGTYVVRI